MTSKLQEGEMDSLTKRILEIPEVWAEDTVCGIISLVEERERSARLTATQELLIMVSDEAERYEPSSIYSVVIGWLEERIKELSNV